jgi:hypothetical protein
MTLQHRIVTWYHDILCHYGETRTKQILWQHFWWLNMRKDIHDICAKCDTCQSTKCSTKNYGHLSAKEVKADPWEVLCVDLTGPYTIKRWVNLKTTIIRCKQSQRKREKNIPLIPCRR